MKVNHTDVNGVTIVELEGRIMLGDGSAFELRDSIGNLLAKGHKNILLNLAGVGYMDTAAVGQLIDAYRHARDLGGEVKLVKLSARVDTMLQVTKLYRVFDIYDDVRTAIARFVVSEAETYPRQSHPTPAEDDAPDAGSARVPG
jgi:anti-sigma B factor antagonist